jgi:hypothetical protein
VIKRIYNRALWEIRSINSVKEWLQLRELKAWIASGKAGPTPHIMKQANLRRLARLYLASTFVETGTCRADMLFALRDAFQKLISVELSEELCRYSRNRCARFPHIEIRQGDSAIELGSICSSLTGRVLFWLDGHYSGGDTALGDSISPIVSELLTIRDRTEIEPIVVIDDARLFKPGTGYPTLNSILDGFRDWPKQMNVSVHDDAIVAIPESLLLSVNS